MMTLIDNSDPQRRLTSMPDVVVAKHFAGRKRVAGCALAVTYSLIVSSGAAAAPATQWTITPQPGPRAQLAMHRTVEEPKTYQVRRSGHWEQRSGTGAGPRATMSGTHPVWVKGTSSMAAKGRGPEFSRF